MSETDFALHISSFLSRYLPGQRNLSTNLSTVAEVLRPHFRVGDFDPATSGGFSSGHPGGRKARIKRAFILLLAALEMPRILATSASLG
jgi:hypothetical protein